MPLRVSATIGLGHRRNIFPVPQFIPKAHPIRPENGLPVYAKYP